MRLAAPLAVFAAAALLYTGTLGHGFVQDDRSIVEQNPLIRSLGGIPTLWRSDYWEPEKRAGLYRPLVTSSYALNYAIGGSAPASYHAVNVLLHGLVSVLVWLWCRAISGSPKLATAAGLLFAAHAVHVEAVANVVGRAELMAAAFVFGGHLAYLRSQRGPGRRGRVWFAASLLALLLGLLCKESAVSLVGLALLSDGLPLPGREGPDDVAEGGWRSRLRAAAPRYAAFVLVVGLYLGARALVLGPDGDVPRPNRLDNPIAALDFPWSTATALAVSLRYLGLLIAPIRLSYDYSYDQIPAIESVADPRLWLTLVVCAALAGLLLWTRRRAPLLFFCGLASVATFFVVSNWVVPIGTLLGERLAYAPSAPFCLALVAVIAEGCRRLPVAAHRRAVAFAVISGVLIAGHAARTVWRAADWASEARLYLHDVGVSPRSARVLNNAGAVLQLRGDHATALKYFADAIEIDPTFAAPYVNTAYSHSAQGRDDRAAAMLERLVAQGTSDPFILNNLGYLLVENELDVDRGVALLERAVTARPFDAEFRDSLGWGYFKRGDLERARAELVRSLELDSTSTTAAARRSHLDQIENALRAQAP